MNIASYRRTLNFISKIDTEQLWMQTGQNLNNIRFIDALHSQTPGRWLAIYAGDWKGLDGIVVRRLVTAWVYTNGALARSSDCREINYTLAYQRFGKVDRTYGIVWTWVVYDLDGLVDTLKSHGLTEEMEKKLRFTVSALEPKLRAA